jgi:hypothetical protein
MRFLPHDEKFFELFDKQIGLVREATAQLCSSTTNNGPASDRAKRIFELEQQGNAALREILERLNDVFITPLDPEDLHDLALHVDKILDNLESVAYRLVAYEMDPVPSDMAQLCKLASDSIEKLCQALDGLKQPKLKDRWQHIAAACEEITCLEHEGQTQARKSVRELLKTEKDAAVLVKKKELYDRLEYTGDSIKETADILRNVIVKNS